MAASYVLVSAAAVVLVEAALLAVMVPRIRASDEAARQAQQRADRAEIDFGQLAVESMAVKLAAVVSEVANRSARQAPGASDATLIADAAVVGVVDGSGNGANDSGQKGADGSGQKGADSSGQKGADSSGQNADSSAREAVRALADTTGRVVATNSPAAYPAGSSLPPAAVGGSGPRRGQSSQDTRGHTSYWASAPVQITSADGKGQRVLSIAYVEVPDTDLAALPSTDPSAGGPGTGAARGATVDTTAQTPNTTVRSFLVPGLVALVLLIPVGALFGLFSTGRLIRRIRRLAEGTSAMAEGDLRVRIPVSGGDEVGRLEHSFNAMAGRLDAAVAEQKAAAGAEARRAERTRIARELHDSISQELFSVSMLAAGMRKALSPGSAVQHQAELMEQAVSRTMREMRALLLELRPIQLEDAGLVVALEQLCRAYEARLGVKVISDLSPVAFDPPVEHAVLRVVQESVGNAIRHGEPSIIELRLTAADGGAEVTVRDNGRGFDPLSTSGRHGMGLDLIRERVRELDGVVEIISAPEQGTTIRVLLPVHVVEPVG